jgi:hypothetical protein
VTKSSNAGDDEATLRKILNDNFNNDAGLDDIDKVDGEQIRS